MLPVGPMMIEHRLIERMIKVVDNRMKRFENDKTIDAEFIDQDIERRGSYERRQTGSQADVLDAQVQQRQEHCNCLLLVPGEDHR